MREEDGCWIPGSIQGFALSVIGQEGVRSEGTRPHRHNYQESYKVGDSLLEMCAASFISRRRITTTWLKNLKCIIYNSKFSRTSSAIFEYLNEWLCTSDASAGWDGPGRAILLVRERESADIDRESDGYYINWLDGCFNSFKWWAHHKSILKFTTFIQHQASRNKAQFFCQSSRQTRSPVAPPPTTTTTNKKQFMP